MLQIVLTPESLVPPEIGGPGLKPFYLNGKSAPVLCLAQVVFSHFVLHSSKIRLVLTTKVTHLRSLLFRQPDGVNCVVRRVYFGGCPKTE